MEETKPEEKQEKPKPTDMVLAANTAAERLEAANKRMEELLQKQEALKVEKVLGGQTEAGQEPVKLSKEELEIKEARAILAGTGLDEYAFPTK